LYFILHYKEIGYRLRVTGGAPKKVHVHFDVPVITSYRQRTDVHHTYRWRTFIVVRRSGAELERIFA
jgi:hypothetical protein